MEIIYYWINLASEAYLKVLIDSAKFSKSGEMCANNKVWQLPAKEFCKTLVRSESL